MPFKVRTLLKAHGAEPRRADAGSGSAAHGPFLL